MSPNLYEEIVGRLPARAAAAIDWTRPALREAWGGPLNGQIGRQEIVRQIFKSFAFSRVVETGTYRGTTTEFLAHLTGIEIYSIECKERYLRYSKRRLRGYSNVHLVEGNSGDVLSPLVTESLKGPIFVYLDAHWNDYLPLDDELSILEDSGCEAVVIIDDFKVEDDSGYRYDDYGHGQSLEMSYLANHSHIEPWLRYHPAIASRDETGAKRGCIVLASKALRSRMDAMVCLRPA